MTNLQKTATSQYQTARLLLTCNVLATDPDKTAASGLQEVTVVATEQLVWRLWPALLSATDDHGDPDDETGRNKADCDWLLDLSTFNTINMSSYTHVQNTQYFCDWEPL